MHPHQALARFEWRDEFLFHRFRSGVREEGGQGVGRAFSSGRTSPRRMLLPYAEWTSMLVYQCIRQKDEIPDVVHG